MLLTSQLLLFTLCSLVVAVPDYSSFHLTNQKDYSQTPEHLSPDSDGKYTLEAPGIRAKFVPYGASISNLFINDTHGVERDIIVGFDNATYYSEDKSHGHWGAVPGRYLNRIKNSTFSLDGQTYHVSANDNNGEDSLHGGKDGWDYRSFTVVAYTSSSITFSIVDPDGASGYPGEVVSYITYTLTDSTWYIKMIAIATTKPTPISLSSHGYWNLDGFANPSTPLILNHTLSLPYGGQRVATDTILIPNGTILPNMPGSVNDFWTQPKQIGANFSEAVGNCGVLPNDAGICTGYDTCFLTNRGQNGPYDWHDQPVASLSSSFSGIQMDIFTDQPAFHVYTCTQENGTLALKKTQGLFDDPARPRVVEQSGCVVFEVEEWVDAINNPEWMRTDRITISPDSKPYVLEAIYKFSVS